MGAIDEEKKHNRETLDSRRNNFNQLKRDLARVEDEETKAKAMVEEAIKQRNTLDDHCKKIKTRIKDNRDKYRVLDQEFGFVFREDLGGEELPVGQAVIAVDVNPNASRQGSRASQIINVAEDDASSHQTLRMKRQAQGFEFHLQNTAIVYNFTEEEINVLTMQRLDI